MNIYVGNLSYDVNSAEIEEMFAEFGSITSAKIITDMQTGKSKGFGFVEMESGDDGNKAIEELNGKELKGRALVVNEARPKREGGGGGHRGGGGGRGGPRGGGGGGGNRGGGRDRRY